MDSASGFRGYSPRWVSPFGHLRINVRLATPRSISQPPTSFIASQRQGIHHTPLVAYLPQSLIRPHLTAQAFQDSGSRSRPLLFAADLSLLLTTTFGLDVSRPHDARP